MCALWQHKKTQPKIHRESIVFVIIPAFLSLRHLTASRGEYLRSKVYSFQSYTWERTSSPPALKIPHRMRVGRGGSFPITFPRTPSSFPRRVLRSHAPRVKKEENGNPGFNFFPPFRFTFPAEDAQFQPWVYPPQEGCAKRNHGYVMSSRTISPPSIPPSIPK